VSRRKIERAGHQALRPASEVADDERTKARAMETERLVGSDWSPAFMDSVDFDPFEIFRRNLYGCQLADEYGWQVLQEVGTKNVMVETDYPHSDTSYPHSLDIVREAIARLPEDGQRDVAYGNALRVFSFEARDHRTIPAFRG
jgi:hypothetical protein